MIIEALQLASQGLLMPSESDYPFTPFIWAGQAGVPLTPLRLLQLTENPPNLPVETVELDDFFCNVAQPREWHDALQQENVAKFQALIEVLYTYLTDIQVYRIGTTQVAVYIVGKTVDDDLAGLSSTMIET
jgi:Nuclease A inhibitor-like protein